MTCNLQSQCRLPYWSPCIALLMACACARAQQNVVFTDPTVPSPLLQKEGSDQAQNPDASQAGPPPSPFQEGPLTLRPHFLYRMVYGDGIQARPGHPSTTFIDTFAPGILAELGSHWTLDYTPTWDVYTSKQFRDTLGHEVSLVAVNSLDDWNVKFVQSYDSSSQPLIETGLQTSEQDYLTNVSVTRPLGSNLLVEGGFEQRLRYAVGFPDSNQWSSEDWLHYKWTQQFDSAVGFDIGYITTSRQADTGFVTPELRLTWSPLQRLTIDVQGGAERRDFYGRPQTGQTTGTFKFAGNYSPFEATTLTVAAGRDVNVSYFANQSVRNTYWNAALVQRLLKHFSLSASIGNSWDDYMSTLGSLEGKRSDSSRSYSVRLGTTLLRRATLSILFQRSRNSSSLQGFSYTSEQGGFEVGFRY